MLLEHCPPDFQGVGCTTGLLVMRLELIREQQLLKLNQKKGCNSRFSIRASLKREDNRSEQERGRLSFVKEFAVCTSCVLAACHNGTIAPNERIERQERRANIENGHIQKNDTVTAKTGTKGSEGKKREKNEEYEE